MPTTIVVCNRKDCIYADEFDFCTKRIIEVEDGVCQIAFEHLLKEIEEKNEQIAKKKNDAE